MSPVPVTPEPGWPLHASDASRAAEAAALAQTPPHALMRRAGLGVARLALALAPHARTVAVLAGPGNNGGDGLVAARHLHAAGKAVRVLLLGDEQRLPADAADALQAARAAGVPIADSLDDCPADLVVDALLGLGTTRAPEGRIAEAIAWAAGRGGPVLAVDLPTGLHADTGQPLGAACVRATATLSLLTLKPGLFTGAGRDLAGRVWLDTLGVEAGAESARLAPAPAPRPRAHVQHKGSFGDVVVVGGAPGMGGAAWLAARAALAAGAGRVYCSPLDPAAALLDPTHPELMGRNTWWRSPPAELAAATVVCGCGGGGAVRAALPPLLAHAARLLLDADALNAVAADPSLQRLLAGRAGRGQQTILTPHPLEAARLLGTGAAEVQADRVAAAERLAARYAAVVVLKGSGSVVAAPGAKPSLNPTGNALLATAGTGDVLAGWIAGSWMPGRDARPVAVDAVWQHGHAADRALAHGATHPLLAGALIDALHATA
ncbi:bifunctional ADP-dependent NAD(P)H-hydrate dehydratase/NAD(P)H-hydrate epimerase [Rubrivivax gelatinosus]|nr:bifunctional ADP-dependent NAD(P)H-hydrate dehydratase/NAD(P)H-hydrate epimerase [Rubrivivax gelatinosus]